MIQQPVSVFVRGNTPPEYGCLAIINHIDFCWVITCDYPIFRQTLIDSAWCWVGDGLFWWCGGVSLQPIPIQEGSDKSDAITEHGEGF